MRGAAAHVLHYPLAHLLEDCEAVLFARIMWLSNTPAKEGHIGAVDPLPGAFGRAVGRSDPKVAPRSIERGPELIKLI